MGANVGTLLGRHACPRSRAARSSSLGTRSDRQPEARASRLNRGPAKQAVMAMELPPRERPAMAVLFM